MNVTEEVTIHRPNASTLLSSAFIMTQVDLAFKFPKLNSMRECLIRKNGTSFFAIGLDGEKKMDFFLGGDAGNEAPGLWFQETSLPWRGHFQRQKTGNNFFSIIYQIFYSKCSFANRFHCSKLLYLTARQKYKDPKILGNISPTLRREEKVPMFLLQENCSN